MLLIIEDNLDLVNLYKMALSLIKITPETEVTGPAALRRIECKGSLPPKVVILDLHLRVENGIEVNGSELCEKMRKVWPHTKIIVASADITSCQKFGGVADMVIEKPIVSMGSFLEQVQAMMT
jgi:DNA-binding response OmpR family regulator